MGKYTKKEVDKLLKKAVVASCKGCVEWIEDDLEIVDATTKEVIPNSLMTTKANPKGILHYVYAELEKEGIKFSNE